MNNQKVALVTGASKGIGKAIAIGLAKIGYKMVLTGRDLNNLENVAGEIRKNKSPEPIIFQLDITNGKKVSETINKIIRETGRIDILVNNAGIFIDGSLSLSEEDFKKLLDTNLTAQFVVLQEIVPIMKKQKSGYIFNIASRAGKIGFSDNAGYNTSKFGLVGLSETLYRELASYGIKVTALCPGWVNTKMAFDAGTPISGEQMIQPEDLFETVKWLLNLSANACVKDVIIETSFSQH